MNHKRKVALLCGIALATLTCNLVAQTGSPNPAASPAGNAGPGAPGKAGKSKGTKLLQTLNLSDEQKAKVAPILEKAKTDAKAIKADGNLTKKQRREQLEAIRTNTEQALQTVLTPEQFQKYQQLKAEHKAAHGKGGKQAGSAA